MIEVCYSTVSCKSWEETELWIIKETDGVLNYNRNKWGSEPGEGTKGEGGDSE